MLETILPLNPRLRKQVLLWGILGVVVGAGSILALMAYLGHGAASQATALQVGAEPMRYVLFVAEVAIVIPVLSLAGLLSYLAVKILKSGQYPPPGIQLLHGTRIQMGDAARDIARLCLLFA